MLKHIGEALQDWFKDKLKGLDRPKSKPESNPEFVVELELFYIVQIKAG